MATTGSRRSAKFVGWLMMALSMLLLLATTFTDLAAKRGAVIPIAMMFLIFAIILLGKSKAQEDAAKRDAP